jgi:hypothetical protein
MFVQKLVRLSIKKLTKNPLDTVHAKNSPLGTVQDKNPPLDTVHAKNSPLDTVHALQINQRVDGRFNSAISLLGSSETSARTGTIYALHELALEEEKYRQQIAQILKTRPHKVGVRQIRSRKFCYFCKILCV